MREDLGLSKIFDWISLGGGAAGYFGALTFARLAQNTNHKIKTLIVEKNSSPLRKVKISGGGRCNVTHRCFVPKELSQFYPRGSKELISVFSRFQPEDIVQWFEERGVKLKTESDGRIFPTTDRSQTVIDLFESERKKLSIQLHNQSSIDEITTQENIFKLKTTENQSYLTKSLLISPGSSPSIWKLLSSMGHQILEPIPSLFSMNINDSRIQGLSGISFEKVEVSSTDLDKKRVSVGPLLITHWGLSGPAILKLSSIFAKEFYEKNYRVKIQVNFAPNFNPEKTQRHLLEHQQRNRKKKLTAAHIRFFPIRYWKSLLNHLQFDPEMTWGNLSKKNLLLVLNQIHQSKFSVQGKTMNKEEFVTCGGVNLKEIDFRTMESKVISNLYFAGEVINVDGFTGGFNFQNAWSTSYLAACSAYNKKL